LAVFLKDTKKAIPLLICSRCHSVR